jgi:hypothetical protein
MKKNDRELSSARRDWIRPELRRIEAGSAESSHNVTPDGGGVNQAS